MNSVVFVYYQRLCRQYYPLLLIAVLGSSQRTSHVRTGMWSCSAQQNDKGDKDSATKVITKSFMHRTQPARIWTQLILISIV